MAVDFFEHSSRADRVHASASEVVAAREAMATLASAAQELAAEIRRRDR